MTPTVRRIAVVGALLVLGVVGVWIVLDRLGWHGFSEPPRVGENADAIIALAVDTLTDTVIQGYRELGLLSAGESGFALAEAGVALVLERLSAARARGARIYGEVLGYSSQNNARHMTDLSPDGAAMASVLCGVFEVAGADPHLIDYVNAHGSSTPQNDALRDRIRKETEY